MKKIFLFLVMLIIIVMIVSFPNFETKKDISLKNNKDNNSLSIMLQDENGKYQEGDNSFNKAGYHFNSKRSKCLMGSKIKYDEEEKEIILNTTKSDRCYAYFDNNNFVEDLSGNGNHGVVPDTVEWNKEGILVKENRITSKVVPNQLEENFSIILRFKININFDLQPTIDYWPIFGSHVFVSFFLMYSEYRMQPYFQVYYTETLHNNAIGNNIKTNEFYTIAGIYNYKKKTLSFYNNGKLESQETITEIKKDEQNINFQLYNGFTFSDVLIFNRTLSDDEIAQDYADKVNPTNKEDLLLWYKF